MFIYEEFMARSSTRKALGKGGNFMGMMNVLMQLRKVCAHPDLFEPRPVITPLVVEPIEFHALSVASNVLQFTSPFHQVSDFLYFPLWSGSEGLPSFQAALRHDPIIANFLLRSEKPTPVTSGQAEFVAGEELYLDESSKSMWIDSLRREQTEKNATLVNINEINHGRCQRHVFPYSSGLLRCVRFREHSPIVDRLDYLRSPQQLFEMIRTQQQRADDVDDLIKNFVFAVPKATTARPSTRKNADFNRRDIKSMLLEPLEELLLPFRKAGARLSSFFPDKKLIQFDAGKLQTLATLLRTLKLGGHRVLIFTQMSKMLDILEAFLNLNGHTYLRLDGSTGVERRQRLMDRFNSDVRLFCFILSTRSGGLGINLTGVSRTIGLTTN
jgi:SNF2 family DNA or RNA helicase